MKYQMGKGDGRRPEDREAVERNWPFPPKKPTRCSCDWNELTGSCRHTRPVVSQADGE